MSLPVASCWKISFVAEEEINGDMENIFLNGWGRVKAELSPFLKLKKLGEFCVYFSAWILKRLEQEGRLEEMSFDGVRVCVF